MGRGGWDLRDYGECEGGHCVSSSITILAKKEDYHKKEDHHSHAMMMMYIRLQ